MKSSRNRLLLRTAATGFAAFVVVGILIMYFPAAYPRALVGALKVMAPLLDEDTSLLEVTMNGTEGTFKIENGKLQRFHDLQGQPLPIVTIDYDFDLGVCNTYPLIIFALLACMPLSIRRRLLLLAIGCAGIFVAGMIDLAIIWNWMGIEGASMVVSRGGLEIPATEANMSVFLEVKKSIERVTLIKSSLSGGGRQFLSLLAAGICLLAVYPKNSGREKKGAT